MAKHQKEIDENIIQAIVRLNWPLPTNKGTRVFIRRRSRDETGLEHIGLKRHHLKISDIQLIPGVLMHPIYDCRDPKNRHNRNFYGRRKGLKQPSFLKIVTLLDRKDSTLEWLITAYPTKRIK